MDYSTTFRRILGLYAEQQAIAAKDCLDRTDADLRRLLDIEAELPQLWAMERQSRALALNGPPRLISAPDPRSVHAVARFYQEDEHAPA